MGTQTPLADEQIESFDRDFCNGELDITPVDFMLLCNQAKHANALQSRLDAAARELPEEPLHVLIMRESKEPVTISLIAAYDTLRTLATALIAERDSPGNPATSPIGATSAPAAPSEHGALVVMLRATALDRDNFPRMETEKACSVKLALNAATAIEALAREVAESKDREGGLAYTTEGGFTPLGKEINRLEAERDELTAKLASAIPVADIEAEIAHIQKNGTNLAALPGMTDEGRCRELCAMYLGEFIASWRLKQKLSAPSRIRVKQYDD